MKNVGLNPDKRVQLGFELLSTWIKVQNWNLFTVFAHLSLLSTRAAQPMLFLFLYECSETGQILMDKLAVFFTHYLIPKESKIMGKRWD